MAASLFCILLGARYGHGSATAAYAVANSTTCVAQDRRTDSTASRPLRDMRWLRLAATFLLLMAVVPAAAKELVQRLSQMGHAVWRTQDGEFESPNAITRTKDGYLWIGTGSGLVRFDGVRFVRWNDFDKLSITSWSIEAILATADGSLWIGSWGRVARIRGREIVEYAVPGRVRHMVEDEAGKVWIAQTRVRQKKGAVCSVNGGEVQCFGDPEQPLRFTQALAVIPGGALWVGGSEGLCRWSPGRQSECYMQDLLKPYAGMSGVQSVISARDGSAWVGIGLPGSGLSLGRLVDRQWQALKLPDFDAKALAVTRLLEDRSGSLWVGTLAAGLYRIRGELVEHFDTKSGLSSNAVAALHEDAEGLVWVATPGGLHQFRSLPVTSFSIADGLHRRDDAAVLPTRDGKTWIGLDQVDSLKNDSLRVMPPPAVFRDRTATSMLEDRSGRIWIGLERTLNVYEKGKLLPVVHKGGVDLGLVARLAEDTERNVWALTFDTQSWIYRIRDLTVVEAIEATKLGSPNEIAPDPQGGLWLGYRNGDLARFKDGALTVHAADAVSRAAVNRLVVDPDGTVLAATAAGILIQRQGARQRLGKPAGLPCERVWALVRDGRNGLWFSTDCGLVHVLAEELDRWLTNPASSIAHRLLDATTGARPADASFSPIAARAPDGRVWFATASSALMVDTEDVKPQAIPPPVVIEEIRADGVAVQDSGDRRLPLHARDLEIRYTALSLILAGKIQFRYLLEGRDTAWQDVGNRRQAIYTDLPPGDYRFRVQAARSDGKWDATGAAIDLSVPAAFYETRWFSALCVAAAAAALYGAYLLRLRQMAGRLQERLAAKASERERIARDLHDTLLQSMQALIFRFQAAARVMPPSDPARSDIERAIDQADEAIAEGRDRVLDLRLAADNLQDLPEAFAVLGSELARRHEVEFRSLVEGKQQPLHRRVKDEVYQIGREALFNAFRHAQARLIELQVIYGDQDFRVRVRDDGIGIEAVTLEAGSRHGHWGLPGMRERAQQFGASLDIWSRDGAGTEIELVVPALQAYLSTTPTSRAPGRLLWLRTGSVR